MNTTTIICAAISAALILSGWCIAWIGMRDKDHRDGVGK